mmetsp:Transcript_41715/g.116269  ORF Transcript_41715/g.116269 Transcript_41715/m.116269 type:complete len:480 (+) Transcript_41715:543-1982(+)
MRRRCGIPLRFLVRCIAVRCSGSCVLQAGKYRALLLDLLRRQVRQGLRVALLHRGEHGRASLRASSGARVRGRHLPAGLQQVQRLPAELQQVHARGRSGCGWRRRRRGHGRHRPRLPGQRLCGHGPARGPGQRRVGPEVLRLWRLRLRHLTAPWVQQRRACQTGRHLPLHLRAPGVRRACAGGAGGRRRRSRARGSRRPGAFGAEATEAAEAAGGLKPTELPEAAGHIGPGGGLAEAAKGSVHGLLGQAALGPHPRSRPLAANAAGRAGAGVHRAALRLLRLPGVWRPVRGLCPGAALVARAGASEALLSSWRPRAGGQSLGSRGRVLSVAACTLPACLLGLAKLAALLLAPSVGRCRGRPRRRFPARRRGVPWRLGAASAAFRAGLRWLGVPPPLLVAACCGCLAPQFAERGERVKRKAVDAELEGAIHLVEQVVLHLPHLPDEVPRRFLLPHLLRHDAEEVVAYGPAVLEGRRSEDL